MARGRSFGGGSTPVFLVQLLTRVLLWSTNAYSVWILYVQRMLDWREATTRMFCCSFVLYVELRRQILYSETFRYKGLLDKYSRIFTVMFFFLYSVHAEDTRFMRAQHGGILRIHAEDTRFMRAQHGAPFWRHFELPRIFCTHFSFWHGRSILACIL